MRYGLIGEKLGHSYSKNIHEKFGAYTYDLIEIDANILPSFIAAREFTGLNVTIPHKKAVLPLCDNLTPAAAAIGSVNTLYFKEGRLIGDNTDYFGFIHMVKRAGICLKGKKVLILGAGGSALTVIEASKNLGARSIITSSRTGFNADTDFSHLNEHFDAEIIVNATPIGMFPQGGQSLVSLKDFPLCVGVIDLIYNPLVTHLLFQARALGIPHTGGLSMLVAQAAKAFELFTGISISTPQIEDILTDLEKEISNIILIGMPGCGKTTIGKLLADCLNRPFADTDQMTEQMAGMKIPQIFNTLGESEFRKLESQAANEIGKSKGFVISTGGGIVMNPLNMKALSQNGIVLFLNRPLESLAREGRPLSTSKAALEIIRDERIPLYKKYSDYIINVTDRPDEIIATILKLLGGTNMRKIVSTTKAPAAIGPYSQANIFGNMVFTSGQVPLVPETGSVVAGGIEEQTEQSLKNVKAVLEEAGSSMDKVLKTTVFIKNMDDFTKMNGVYAKFFTEGAYPSRSAVEVARLPKDVLVEIEAIAYL